MMQEFPAARRPAFIEATPDAGRALNRQWLFLAPRIEGFALHVANCPADFDDLTMEAMETFWMLGPWRFDLTNVDDLHYVSKILVNRMCRVWGRGNLKKQEEAERAVRAVIGADVLLRAEEERVRVENGEVPAEGLLNAEDGREIGDQREDVDEEPWSEDERDAA